MARLIKTAFTLVSALVLFASCSDVFFETSQVLYDVKDSRDIPEPKRIFLGGSFSYNWGWSAFNQSGFAALNGQGNGDYYFLRTYGSGLVAGPSGVLDIDVTGGSIYVAGDITGYDTAQTGTSDPQFQSVVRYARSGTLDQNFHPYASAGVSVLTIQPVKNSSGQEFVLAGGDYGAAQWDSSSSPNLYSSGGTSYAYPSVALNEKVYALLSLFDNAVVFVGGQFATLGSNTGFSNLAAVSSENPVSSSELTVPGTPIQANTEIRDYASYGDKLYAVGMNSSQPVIYRYVLSESGIVEDNAYYTTFINDFSSGSGSASALRVVTTDSSGLVYLGGTGLSWSDPISGFYHSGILRLQKDGHIDRTFKVSTDQNVYAIEFQKNGKILLGGDFAYVSTSKDSTNCSGYMRLDESGNIDWNFDWNQISGTVYAIAIEEE